MEGPPCSAWPGGWLRLPRGDGFTVSCPGGPCMLHGPEESQRGESSEGQWDTDSGNEPAARHGRWPPVWEWEFSREL